MKNPRTNKQTKPERKKIESIPVVPQSTKMTKKETWTKTKQTNYY
jgi:hypothetical protein